MLFLWSKSLMHLVLNGLLPILKSNTSIKIKLYAGF
jgi:hypothetical protein